MTYALLGSASLAGISGIVIALLLWRKSVAEKNASEADLKRLAAETRLAESVTNAAELQAQSAAQLARAESELILVKGQRDHAIQLVDQLSKNQPGGVADLLRQAVGLPSV